MTKVLNNRTKMVSAMRTKEEAKRRYIYEKRWLERLKQDPTRKDVLERLKEKRRRARKKYYQRIKSDPEKYKKYLERLREWRKKNPDKMKKLGERYYAKHRSEKCERVKRWHQTLKLEVLTHYSNGEPHCACCGESRVEFLCIDHIQGGGLKHRRIVGTGTAFYKWLKKNGFPSGYQVLCYNCNMAKAIYGVCPHKQKGLPVTEPYPSKLGHEMLTPESLLDK